MKVFLNWALFALIILSSGVSASEPNFSLVYVHIGPKFPEYLPVAIRQARTFNSNCPIYLVGNTAAFSDLDYLSLGVTPVFLESLKITSSHRRFKRMAKGEGLFHFAVERFLYLNDFVQQYHLKNVFHTENDVMIYFDIEQKLKQFEECYSGMIATAFDCDERSVPSFVYISDEEPLEKLAFFIGERSHLGTTDMELLCLFKDAYYKQCGDHLPILIPSYAEDHSLTSLSKKTAKSATPYSSHLDKLGLIFDAAALGQFFGGIDPILSNKGPGFIAELSVFFPTFFHFRWQRDEVGRWVPYISYRGVEYPIANLHIHCKELQAFYSLNQEFFPLPTIFWSSMPLDGIL